MMHYRRLVLFICFVFQGVIITLPHNELNATNNGNLVTNSFSVASNQPPTSIGEGSIRFEPLMPGLDDVIQIMVFGDPTAYSCMPSYESHQIKGDKIEILASLPESYPFCGILMVKKVPFQKGFMISNSIIS